MNSNIVKTARRHLRSTDSVMARLVERYEPHILSSAKAQPRYHALVRAIINQQLSVKAGRTIEKRLQEKQGGRYFKAEQLLKLKDTVLRECGISHNKIRYIHTLSRAVVSGELNFRKLAQQDDDGVRDTLTQYPGIGRWSADIFLITSLRRLDVLPLGDLVLRRSMQRHYRLPDEADQEKYLTIAEAWRPYRTVASYYLWAASG